MDILYGNGGRRWRQINENKVRPFWMEKGATVPTTTVPAIVFAVPDHYVNFVSGARSAYLLFHLCNNINVSMLRAIFFSKYKPDLIIDSFNSFNWRDVSSVV